jgi:hypothetical protein
MNDIFEFWSLPWHALQRSLANALVAETVRSAAPAARSSKSVADLSASGSWLARARSGLPQTHQASR